MAEDFLLSVVKGAAGSGIFFGRIMTNGVWYKDKEALTQSLARLYEAGYDGDICVSVDAFHRQDLKKVARFIEEALSVWRRPDVVSIAYTAGAKESQTINKLKILSRLLKSRLVRFGGRNPTIRGRWLFIRILKIEMSPVRNGIKPTSHPWGVKWFREDYCRGPGNVFSVMPDGSVKPCCGYATNCKELTIGNIKRDTAQAILNNAKRNRYVRTVFNSGLSAIRKRLERAGIKFPGKASNHCYFCSYILSEVPRNILNRCLEQAEARDEL